jgi:hypothetical protein
MACCAFSNKKKAIWVCKILCSQRIAIHCRHINRRLGASSQQSSGQQAPLGLLKGDGFLFENFNAAEDAMSGFIDG